MEILIAYVLIVFTLDTAFPESEECLYSKAVNECMEADEFIFEDGSLDTYKLQRFRVVIRDDVRMVVSHDRNN